MDPFASSIRAALASHTGLDEGELRLESPRDAALGDYAFPCFPLAKALRKAPPAIATDLATGLAESLSGIEVLATGPYLNFRVERGLLASTVIGMISEAQQAGRPWGASDEGAGRTVVLDFSSPNIAKPMSVGHLRSTVIGAAIQRLHDALGYETVGINHIGDWGSQFGKLVAAVNRWGETVELEEDPIISLLALYVRYHEEEQDDPTLKEEGRAAFRELESGEDGAVRAIWRHLTELSLGEFDKLYSRLGVTFDEVRGESFYETHLEGTVKRVETTGITEMSEGALIVDLSETEKNMPPCLLRKTDGTTLYATRDLAAVFHRHQLYNFERCLYMVGSDQKLHFRQLKGVLARMGLDWEQRVEHIAFGMLRLPEGKMSTRAGRVVFLDDVLDRAVEEARRIIAEKNPSLEGADEVAEAVGVGAVVFNDLKRERVKDVEFVWEEVLSFEGETGPYVQYTHARLSSILRKGAEAGEVPSEPQALDGALLADAAPLLMALLRFPDVLRSAAAHAEPSEVVSWLLAFCRETNAWYGRNRVLGQESALTGARLALIQCSKLVIASSLQLIGVAAPEEM
ncbi:MAG: arginine--tRNA ligase [Planctomycetota bacterium]|nr:arginine--tRNA ligase [Planctomycetota bacterium]MDP6518696.1 arginine--tRNA ligase [Planctomycetota bacterium]MDP6956621.1 arginine--tRNA ligase [Planctomycetota bacterium]